MKIRDPAVVFLFKLDHQIHDFQLDRPTANPMNPTNFPSVANGDQH